MTLPVAEIEPLSPTLVPLFEHACSLGMGRSHALQVTRLSLGLFTLLAPLHQYDSRERAWLQCAALLHDIGWVDGPDRHHKRSYRHILTLPLPFPERQRLMIALIARYHRRALPKAEHDGYRDLFRPERKAVRVLAGLLRVADGLDITHANNILTLDDAVSPESITVICTSRYNAEQEREAALAKGTLFERVFERALTITWSNGTS